MTIKKKKSYTNCWTNHTHHGQRPKARTMTIQSGKGDLKHNRLDKIERKKTTVQMKKQDKKPQGQINEEEIVKQYEK